MSKTATILVAICIIGWVVEYLKRKNAEEGEMFWAELAFRWLLHDKGGSEVNRGAPNNKEGGASNPSDGDGDGTCLPDSAPRVRGPKTEQRGQAATDRKDSKR